jgi:aryl-alcohol dehydrogenase-like predicted oxidoreductase
MVYSATGGDEPHLVLGTMAFGDNVDEKQANAIIDAALERGIRELDTANVYSGGACELLLGRVLRRGIGDVVLTTKVGIPHDDADGAAPLSAAGIRRSVQGSFERLGVERVDVLYVHQPDAATPLDETAETFADLHAEGRFTAYGLSNVSADYLRAWNAAAERVGLVAPARVQQLYNPLARRIEDDFLASIADGGPALHVYNPLAGGLLSGKQNAAGAPVGGRFQQSALSKTYTDRYWTDGLRQAVAQLQELAAQADMRLPELAFRWLVSKQAVAGFVLGASKPEQIVANVDAIAAGSLPAELVAACDAATEPHRDQMPAFAR